MFSTRKEGNDVLELKRNGIITPVIAGIVMVGFGIFLLRDSLQGAWTETGEDMAFTIIGAVLLVGGFFVGFLVSHIDTYRFDKKSGKIKYNRKRLVRPRRSEYSIDDVSHILVHERRRRSTDKDGNTKTKVWYEYLLEFSNGMRVSLGTRRRRGGMITSMAIGAVPEAIEDVSKFLEIPVKEHTRDAAISSAIGTFTETMTGAKSGGVSHAEQEKGSS